MGHLSIGSLFTNCFSRCTVPRIHGWYGQTHCHERDFAWPPVGQPRYVPEAFAEHYVPVNGLSVSAMQALLPGTLYHVTYSDSLIYKKTTWTFLSISVYSVFLRSLNFVMSADGRSILSVDIKLMWWRLWLWWLLFWHCRVIVNVNVDFLWWHITNF